MYEDVRVSVGHDFEAIYRSVFPRLVSLGAVKTGRIDVARELAQETMLRAHARWSELADHQAPISAAFQGEDSEKIVERVFDVGPCRGGLTGRHPKKVL